MASVAKEPNGNRRILFVAPDGKRKTIRLGKVSQRVAEAIKYRVEQLVATKLTGHALESDTALWVASLSSGLAAKLAKVELIPDPQTASSVKLGEFLDSYMAGRVDVKPASKLVWGHVRRNLVDFFGCDRDVRTVLPGNADDFKQWLLGQKLAPTTIHKRLKFARTFFRAMQRYQLIEENPFADVKLPASGVRERQRFITRDEIARVLAACPNHHWRTIVVLSRYGGLRTPSETLSLRWKDVLWDRERLLVNSPKTEHHAGKGTRMLPLFPELRASLMEARQLASAETEFVVDERFRKAAMGPGGWANANLRTTFEKIIRRAGMEPWPRLFHNLRASRETELVETHPIQVVTSWLGNTPTVAMQHYLITTEEHFAAAVRGTQANDNKEEETAQNAAQQAYVWTRRTSYEGLGGDSQTEVLQELANSCEIMHPPEVEPRGLEPLTS